MIENRYMQLKTAIPGFIVSLFSFYRSRIVHYEGLMNNNDANNYAKIEFDLFLI